METLRDLSPQDVRDAMDYDPDTGQLTWRRRPWVAHRVNQRLVGKPAGHPCPMLGYVLVRINTRLYRAHRIIWLHITGYWPTIDVDHINGDGLDNRWDNLRHADRCQNASNARIRSDNKSGVRGVSWSKQRNKWLVHISHQGKVRHVGFYETIEDARLAYAEAARRLHGEFARTS